MNSEARQKNPCPFLIHVMGNLSVPELKGLFSMYSAKISAYMANENIMGCRVSTGEDCQKITHNGRRLEIF